MCGRGERTIETQVKTALRRAKKRDEENKYEKKEGGREREREKRGRGGGDSDKMCVLRSVNSETQNGREKARTDQKPRQAGGDIRKSISGAGGGGEASCVLPPPTHLLSAQPRPAALLQVRWRR